MVDSWVRLAVAGDWEGLARALLEQHYDPAYRRKFDGHRRRMLGVVSVGAGETADLQRAVEEIRGADG